VLLAKLKGKYLDKSADRCSDWEASLTGSQQRYAALDALASLEVGEVVLATDDPRLTPQNAIVGTSITVVVKGRTIASGIIVNDLQWCGYSTRGRDSKQIRAVVEISEVKIPAAYVPILPRPTQLPVHWPVAHADGRRPTLGEIASALPVPSSPFKLIINIANLHKA
jgi:hypothetical protein